MFNRRAVFLAVRLQFPDSVKMNSLVNRISARLEFAGFNYANRDFHQLQPSG